VVMQGRRLKYFPIEGVYGWWRDLSWNPDWVGHAEEDAMCENEEWRICL